jgi:pyridoxine 5-phosphate synthase
MILGVNVDHVATIRQARGGKEPDPAMAASMAIVGGADGITVHLREDRRHIQDRDLRFIKQTVKCVPVEFNLEMAAVKEMIDIALKIKPDMVTLVPERRAELTTEGGLDLRRNEKKIKRAISIIQDKGIAVSLFINPYKEDIMISKEIGAQMVEIHTGFYADAKGKRQIKELEKVEKAVEIALHEGLSVNAGHGLNYSNVKNIASIKGLRGLYIGHSIISRSVFVGIENAVREMKKLIEEAVSSSR